MSKGRGLLVLHAGVEELRLVRAQVDRFTVELSEPAVFPAANRNEDCFALTDESALDNLAAYISERRWFGYDVICLVGGSQVACQYHDLPPLKGIARHQAVQLKLAQQLHFDPADAIVTVDATDVECPVAENRQRVGVVACHNDVADATLSAVERVGLNIIAMTATSSALTALARDSSEKDGLHAFLCLDEHASTLVVIDGTVPCVTTELPIGTADLTAALMRPIVAGDDVIELDEIRAVALRDEIGIPSKDQLIESLNVRGDRILPLLEPVLQKLAGQLTQWLTFASTSSDGKQVKSLRLVGPGATISGLAGTVSSRISTETSAFDWVGGTRMSGADEDVSPASFSAAVGAIRHWRDLPDLLPARIRRYRRISRIRRSICITGPVLAGAIMCIAILFNRIDMQIRPPVPRHEQQLRNVRDLLGGIRQQWDKKIAADSVHSQLAEFSDAAPPWIGIFKELSLLLPKEFFAERFDARMKEGRMFMTIVGEILTSDESPRSDELVEQLLKSLDDSPFCHGVELKAWNRSERGKAGSEGTLSFEFALAYPGAEASL
ncbi:MAG: hypothetical protein O7F76_12465 [Planctomycetota bacterium]|nr:hypothetical protein [Planctomycetota bacterium]